MRLKVYGLRNNTIVLIQWSITRLGGSDIKSALLHCCIVALINMYLVHLLSGFCYDGRVFFLLSILFYKMSHLTFSLINFANS